MHATRIVALGVAGLLGGVLLGAGSASAADSLGREFWLAELSASPSRAAQFGVLIAVANPGPTEATVTIDNVVAGTREIRVPAGGFASTDYRATQPNASGVFREPVYHVTSDVDVGVTAFVPSRDMADNDATLVLPADALGTDHVLAGWVSSVGTSFANFAAVVAASPGETVVTLTDDRGVVVETVVLAQGEMYQRLQGTLVTGSLSAPEDDMTGWRVATSRPAAVFTGVDCISILAVNACDHVDEQVAPVSSLSSRYLAMPTRLRPLGCSDACAPDAFRFVAVEDATSVTTTPDVGSALLDAGEWLEVVTAEPFIAAATAPLAAWQYLVSQEAVLAPADAPGIGDPSLLAVVPVEHFTANAMAFAHDVPPPLLEFERDFLRVVAPEGTTVRLDGALVALPCDASIVLDGTTWCAGWIEVTDGGHRVEADAPIGVTVAGLSNYSSYLATAGRDVRPLAVGCDAGSPASAPPCERVVTLSGTASCPDGATPMLEWSSSDGVTFTDAGSPTTSAMLPGFGDFEACLAVACPGLPERTCCVRADATPGIELPLAELSAPGSPVPLLVARDENTVALSFELPPDGAGADVLEGRVASLWTSTYDHAALACEVSGGIALLAMPAGDAYWLVAAGACTAPRIEGPTGRASTAARRPLGMPGCP